MKKTKVERPGVLSDQTKSLLEALQETLKKQPDDKIYPETVNALKKRLNRYLKHLKLGHTTHDFRHTKLTDLGNSGIKLK